MARLEPAAYVIGSDVICAPCVANHPPGLDTSCPIVHPQWYPGHPTYRCAVCAERVR